MGFFLVGDGRLRAVLVRSTSRIVYAIDLLADAYCFFTFIMISFKLVMFLVL